ncbi:glycosyltransferase family 4 protein [Enemella evansiae]|uniref:glycosyltransferase family 4 protein n=1 Tax=Enemella evansiae TaxID=2016499 RepID=UPI000B96288A|nr:glycosyltransferase family 4 protein [Enemella evansiae]OYO18261.1 alpha-(1-2)-phosphatidylinositol mannosyltransferase [Enemella evansiae]TDO93816.1 phosphatidylinositol alpha-1,6-mannosyltransferase [Enemella evansiae]
MSRTTLVISNDFPPRIGGIENFVATVCDLLDGDVVVLTSDHPDAAAHDRELSFPVHRLPGPLLPTGALAERGLDLLHRYRASRIVYGAAAPLGLLGDRLRPTATRQFALSHGHEVWWASLPGSRRLLRRIGDRVDAISTISGYAAARIAPALSAPARARLVRLPPPIDPAFTATAGERAPGPPVVLAAARMIRQKGLDTLIEAWRLLRRDHPDLPGRLRLLGDGPQRPALLRRAAGLADVEFGGGVPHPAMPAELARAALFAAPVRTRLGGLNPEGLGLAMLEAAAVGLPVLVGDSGGAPETVTRSSGLVLPDDPYAWSAALAALLADPARRAAMGAAGSDHVRDHFGTAAARRTLRTALDLPLE